MPGFVEILLLVSFGLIFIILLNTMTRVMVRQSLWQIITEFKKGAKEADQEPE